MVKASSDILARMGNGFKYNLIGTVFNQGSTFVFSIIMANLIGKKAFGEYSMTIGTLSAVALLTQLACGITNTKYVAEFRNSNKPKAGRILTLTLILTFLTGVLASAGLLFSSKYIALNVVNNDALSDTLRLGSFYILFASLITYLLGALAGLGGYRRIARSGVVSGIVYLCLAVSLSSIYGLHGAVFGVFISAVIQSVILTTDFFLECRAQEICLTLDGIKSEMGIITTFMIPAAVSSYISAPAAWGANAFLARQSIGYEELALYSAANNIRLLVLFIPNIVNTVSMSLINNTKNNSQQYKYAYMINILTMVLVAAVVALPVSLFGKTVLGLFGSKFVTGYPILLLLLVSTIPESLGIALFQHIHAQNRMWLSLVAITIPQSLVLLCMSYAFTPTYGAKGLAIAYTASWILALATTLITVKAIGHGTCGEDVVTIEC